MAKTETTGSQTTSSAPWAPAQPYLQQSMGQAQNLFANNVGAQQYGGPTVVPFSSQTQQAMQGTQNIANQGDPLAGQSMGAISGILGGANADAYKSLYDSTSNPAFAQNLQHGADMLTNSIGQQYSQGGRYGSDAQANAVGENVGNFLNTGIANQWQQNIANQRGILGDQTNAQLNAIQAAPGAYEQQYAPYQHLAQVGAQNEDLTQRQYQDAQTRFNNNQQLPWQQLAQYNSIISGAGQLGGSGTSSVQQPNNLLGQILGGASLGAGILGNSGGLKGLLGL